MARKIYLQYDSTTANDVADDINDQFIAAEIDDTYVAVVGQVDNYFVVQIPKTREAEFEAADTEKQNNFALFTSLALGVEHQGEDFLDAWEEEYVKVYG